MASNNGKMALPMTHPHFMLSRHASHQKALRARLAQAPLSVRRRTFTAMRCIRDRDADADMSPLIVQALGATVGQFCVLQIV